MGSVLVFNENQGDGSDVQIRKLQTFLIGDIRRQSACFLCFIDLSDEALICSRGFDKIVEACAK